MILQRDEWFGGVVQLDLNSRGVMDYDPRLQIAMKLGGSK
ncbi:unnamed protein product [Acidithrix sp. C25]|nr:unnamed protein product [Acidithrix sp. C25]